MSAIFWCLNDSVVPFATNICSMYVTWFLNMSQLMKSTGSKSSPAVSNRVKSIKMSDKMEPAAVSSADCNITWLEA